MEYRERVFRPTVHSGTDEIPRKVLLLTEKIVGSAAADRRAVDEASSESPTKSDTAGINGLIEAAGKPVMPSDPPPALGIT